MSELSTLFAARAPAEGGFDVDVPAGWGQGRGAYGGLVLGMMTAAAAANVGDPERRLRTLSGELYAPVAVGPAHLRVELLRAGSAVTTVSVQLSQVEPRATAIAVFGRDRPERAQWPTLTPPTPPPWRDVEPMPEGLPFVPEFAQHFEFRNTGPIPFSRDGSACSEGWLRPRVAPPVCDDAWLVAMADCWWPALLPALEAPRPMATLGFTLQVVGALDGVDPAAPLFHRGRVLAGEGGYLVEQRELWTEDGRLVALNPQTFVLIK